MNRCRLPLSESGEGAEDVLPACRASLAEEARRDAEAQWVPLAAQMGTARCLSRTAQTLEELDRVRG